MFQRYIFRKKHWEEIKTLILWKISRNLINTEGWAEVQRKAHKVFEPEVRISLSCSFGLLTALRYNLCPWRWPLMCLLSLSVSNLREASLCSACPYPYHVSSIYQGEKTAHTEIMLLGSLSLCIQLHQYQDVLSNSLCLVFILVFHAASPMM